MKHKAVKTNEKVHNQNKAADKSIKSISKSKITPKIKSVRKTSKAKLKSEILETFNKTSIIGPENSINPINISNGDEKPKRNCPFTEDDLKLIPKSPLHFTKQSKITSSITDPKDFPSVGKILQATMSESARNALMKWKTLKISELGETGFADLQKSYLDNGKLFHSTIENYLLIRNIPDATSNIYDTWQSVSPFIQQISDAPLVEKSIYHPHLKYKGIVDCVASVNNELCIIEWKKSDRRKSDISATYDAPVQMCAYLGAINANPELNLKIKKGIVVIAYTNGDPADTYVLDQIELRKYWMVWVLRVQEYWIRQRDGTMLEPI